MGWHKWVYSILVFLAVPLLISSSIFDEFPDLLPGSYCSKINRCCNGRQDGCAFPLLGTLCYCDEFCNTTRVNDCCPDYWTFCRGIPSPIISCPVRSGQTQGIFMENCNKCKCDHAVEVQPRWLCETNKCLINENIIQTVNTESPYGWTASNYSKFWGKTLAYGVERRLGTLPPQRFVMRMNPVRWTYDPNALPKEFEAEKEWPGFISPIRDQGWCASSWAISTAEVASDRYAIFSAGREHVNLSAQNLLSCNIKGQRSCNGGHLDRAWSFVRYNGLVDEDCFPYSGEKKQECTIRQKGRLEDAGCKQPEYKDRKNRYTVSPAYRLGNETDIMYEIQKSGPVQATMKVFHDFFMYRGGIYRRTDLSINEAQGYHSVRIVGWGQEYTLNGVQKYWKVANSWGTEWGENGYFRIVRGSNECEIESFVIAVWPHIDRKIVAANANKI